jgi:hypothetical protein
MYLKTLLKVKSCKGIRRVDEHQLFCFPGMTDSVEEYEALRKLISETG